MRALRRQPIFWIWVAVLAFANAKNAFSDSIADLVIPGTILFKAGVLPTSADLKTSGRGAENISLSREDEQSPWKSSTQTQSAENSCMNASQNSKNIDPLDDSEAAVSRCRSFAKDADVCHEAIGREISAIKPSYQEMNAAQNTAKGTAAAALHAGVANAGAVVSNLASSTSQLTLAAAKAKDCVDHATIAERYMSSFLLYSKNCDDSEHLTHLKKYPPDPGLKDNSKNYWNYKQELATLQKVSEWKALCNENIAASLASAGNTTTGQKAVETIKKNGPLVTGDQKQSPSTTGTPDTTQANSGPGPSFQNKDSSSMGLGTKLLLGAAAVGGVALIAKGMGGGGKSANSRGAQATLGNCKLKGDVYKNNKAKCDRLMSASH